MDTLLPDRHGQSGTRAHHSGTQIGAKALKVIGDVSALDRN